MDSISVNQQILRLFGNLREEGEDMGVLGVLHPPNTPYFLPHYANSQRTEGKGEWKAENRCEIKTGFQ